MDDPAINLEIIRLLQGLPKAMAGEIRRQRVIREALGGPTATAPGEAGTGAPRAARQPEVAPAREQPAPEVKPPAGEQVTPGKKTVEPKAASPLLSEGQAEVYGAARTAAGMVGGPLASIFGVIDRALAMIGTVQHLAEVWDRYTAPARPKGQAETDDVRGGFRSKSQRAQDDVEGESRALPARPAPPSRATERQEPAGPTAPPAEPRYATRQRKERGEQPEVRPFEAQPEPEVRAPVPAPATPAEKQRLEPEPVPQPAARGSRQDQWTRSEPKAPARPEVELPAPAPARPSTPVGAGSTAPAPARPPAPAPGAPPASAGQPEPPTRQEAPYVPPRTELRRPEPRQAPPEPTSARTTPPEAGMPMQTARAPVGETPIPRRARRTRNRAEVMPVRPKATREPGSRGSERPASERGAVRTTPGPVRQPKRSGTVPEIAGTTPARERSRAGGHEPPEVVPFGRTEQAMPGRGGIGGTDEQIVDVLQELLGEFKALRQENQREGTPRAGEGQGWGHHAPGSKSGARQPYRPEVGQSARGSEGGSRADQVVKTIAYAEQLGQVLAAV